MSFSQNMKQSPRSHRTRASGRGESERGLNYLTLAIFGAVIGAALFYAYHVLPMYYYFYELQGQFQQSIKTAGEFTDEEIRRRLLVQINEMEIPAEPEALEINRSDHQMRIRLKYKEYFEVPWQGKYHTLQTFVFDADASGKF